MPRTTEATVHKHPCTVLELDAKTFEVLQQIAEEKRSFVLLKRLPVLSNLQHSHLHVRARNTALSPY
eukprot:1232690-Pyramimonas_sp.AAC.1